MKKRTILFLVFFLAMLDEGIKQIINKYYLDLEVELIPNILYFMPKFNEKYFYINSFLNLDNGYLIHLGIILFAFLVLGLLWNGVRALMSDSSLVDLGFSFTFAGAICSLMGTVCWGGCLDYIYFKPYFIFDLKDVYLHGIAAFIIIQMLISYKAFENCTTKKLVQHLKSVLSKKS